MGRSVNTNLQYWNGAEKREALNILRDAALYLEGKGLKPVANFVSTKQTIKNALSLVLEDK